MSTILKQFDKAEILKEKEDVIVLRFFENHSFTVKELQEKLKSLFEFSKCEKSGLLVVTADRMGVENNLFKHDFMKTYPKNIKCQAIVVRSLATRLIVNFYLSIFKSIILTKVFDDELKANKWLNEQLN